MTDMLFVTMREAVGRRLILWSVVPSALFWFAVWAVQYSVLADPQASFSKWAGLGDASRSSAIVVAITMILATSYAVGLIRPLVRRVAFGEWHDIPIIGSSLATKAEKKWRKRAEAARAEYSTLADNDRPSEYERRRLMALERQVRNLPQMRYAQTGLGNTLRAALEDQLHLYGLEATVVWPRLYFVVPDAMRTAIDRSEDNLDGMMSGSLLSLIAGAYWLALGLRTNSEILVVLGLLAAGNTYLVYRASVEAARAYAELIRAAFDLYRFKLYRELSLELPGNTDEEALSGAHLTSVLVRGRPTDFVHREKPQHLG